ncbi:MAG: magnesium-translocating P-type ATPase [Nitrospira sp.]|jgi:Mg2+-importing ATPase|nr:magnesium-translocating P-type ATPase [Nitrospira sp.]
MTNGHPFWARPLDELLRELRVTPEGLSTAEAEQRQAVSASARLKPQRDNHPVRLLLAQFRSPIILILLFASGVSFFLAEHSDALIILAIILVSALLSFWQEYSAARAVAGLLALVQITARARRDGELQEVPADHIVPGDIVELSAGSSLPGDARLLEAKDLFVDEATLTGETYPAEKSVATLTAEASLQKRTNSLFLGTHVVSGQARALIVAVGKDTEFGRIANRMQVRAPETEFERGVRRFGYLLLEVTLLLVLSIFAVNVYLARPVLESFLFSMALAVGLTPQLLPAIISVNLSHGAKRMAQQRVVVKRLASIENFGSMNVLCSDKTGTLTEGSMRLHAALNLQGQPSEKVLFLAYANAMFETGFPNPLDEALRRHQALDLSGYRKLEEEPYDFVRKRLSILVATPQTHLLITKGAVESMLAICLDAEQADGTVVPIDQVQSFVRQRVRELSAEGFRTLGLASRDMDSAERVSKEHETAMTFLGLLVFADPPKPGMAGTVAALKGLGVSLKMVTGDQALVAAYVGRAVGLDHPRLLTGTDLRGMSDDALRTRANSIDIFAEIEPNQKERIIRALRASGNVVGYLGDGINDAPALHAADVGISVDSAVDVAKEAADLVLLEHDLSVLVQGVREGRMTFSNTLKYVFMATSANFGNMFSMAGASLFLPFLPLLPKQILLTNVLTDLPEMTIATDRVDHELIERPRRWDIPFIRRFMLTFGLVSSLFDYLTFGVLLLLLHSTTGQFRTGWFVESVLSASLIVLVIRTRRPFYSSRPSTALLLTTLLTGLATMLLPMTPVGTFLGFEPLPPIFWAALLGILLGYVAAAELAKKLFYRHANNGH